ncbi:hypothetical protein P8452_17967 [Trifolium repens]|nr:hypothetical protein P8452_17967 [Trifolium repens]
MKPFIFVFFIFALVIISIVTIEPSKNEKQCCERKKLKTKIRYQKPWKNWATFSFGSKRKRGARSKKGGQGSGGSGSRENSGEEGAQGGGEQNGGGEDKES